MNSRRCVEDRFNLRALRIPMIKSLIDAVIAAGMYRLILLPFLVVPFIAYLVLTSERRKKAPETRADGDKGSGS
jgi:hypothetical protein